MHCFPYETNLADLKGHSLLISQSALRARLSVMMSSSWNQSPQLTVVGYAVETKMKDVTLVLKRRGLISAENLYSSGSHGWDKDGR